MLYNKKNKKLLSDLVDIRFGFYSQLEFTGEVSYLQVRQFNDYGQLTSTVSDCIERNKNSEAHLLKDGDILFVGKGNRLFAWCYRDKEGPAVASSIFFVLRPNQKLIYPEYLAAILNAPQSKIAFQQLGSGTNIFSIRKSELGAFQVPVPSMQRQKKVAALADLHLQEIVLVQQLMAEKQHVYTVVISELIK